MPTPTASRANMFRNILARFGAALREQREIEARRTIRRYRHLLAPPCETAPACDALVNSKDKSEHAHGPDAHQSAPGDAVLERA